MRRHVLERRRDAGGWQGTPRAPEANIRVPVHHRCRCHSWPRGGEWPFAANANPRSRHACRHSCDRRDRIASSSLSILAAPPRIGTDKPLEGRPEDQQCHAIGPTLRLLAAQLVGPGVTISNAKFTGAPEAAGTFAGGAASVGMDTGVVLSTGQAVNVRGPNVGRRPGATSTARRATPRLDALVTPEVTYDAATLEFDVTPAANTIAIRFVFASEEYPEFVGSSYNDVIAIFVNGVNCANYNGRPVASIDQHRHQQQLFIDNDTGTRNTEMDGLTVPLDCVASVTPNATNHVTIVIADTRTDLRSAVFLASGGIRSPGSGPVTNSNVIRAVEYYHAGFNHYFVTTIADEITKLDNGTFKGWARTGKAFNLFTWGHPERSTCPASSAPPLVSTVISTHFYTANAPETACTEGQSEMDVRGRRVRHAAARGDVPGGTTALYRAYNNSKAGVPNHRFLTDLGELQYMVSLGWIREGDYGIMGCVPL